MKLVSWVLLSVILLTACGNKESKYTVNFANEKDKLSYVLGAMNAKTISDSKTESFEKLDKKEID